MRERETEEDIKKRVGYQLDYKRYAILSADSPWELEKQVGWAMELAWEPIGGVGFSFNNGRNSGSRNETFHQAVKYRGR